MQQSGPLYIPTPGYGTAVDPYGQQPGHPGQPSYGATTPGYPPQQPVYGPAPAGYPPQQPVYGPAPAGYPPQQPNPPAQQAAPVSPVGLPAYPQNPGPQPQAQAQTPQQALARQLIGVARHLEQGMPGIHLTAAIGQDALGDGAASADRILQTAKEAAFYHSAGLGAIRRYLSGETSQLIAVAVAANIKALMLTIDQMVQVADLVATSNLREPKPAWVNLPQIAQATQTAMKQAAAAAQASLGSTWDTAEARSDI